MAKSNKPKSTEAVAPKPEAAKPEATKPEAAKPHADATGFCPCLTGFYSPIQRRKVSAFEARAAQADGLVPGGAVSAGFSHSGIAPTGGLGGTGGFGAVFQTSAAWNSGMGQPATIRVCFLDNERVAGMREKVKTYARLWSKACGVTFQFDAPQSASDIRIKFNAPGFRSYVGTESRTFEDSMWLGFTGGEKERDVQRLVLHEFGHAIGLCHEHQHPESGIEWNLPVAIARLAPGLPAGTPEPEIRKQLELGPPNGRKFKIEPFDADSIMLYRLSPDMVRGHFDPAWNKDNFELSAGDKKIARMIYGPGTDPLPSDEEAPKELKVDGPPLADDIKNDVDVDRFFFDAPRFGRYTITVMGDAYVHVDLTDKEWKNPHPDNDGGADTLSRSLGLKMVLILDEGRQYLRLTGSKDAEGFARGSYMIKVVLKPQS